MNKIEKCEMMFTLLTDWKIAGINVEDIWCDDSGENKLVYNARCARGYNIKFEFSGNS